MTPQSSGGFTGTVNLQLTDLIQMVCLSRSDLIISVRSSEGRGYIYVREGSIHHAQAGSLEGEEAFFEIFRWKDGQFEILPFESIDSPPLKRTWEYLLLEAVRRSDEREGKEEDFEGETASKSQTADELDRAFAGIAPDTPLASPPDAIAEAPRQSERPRRVLIVDDSAFFSRQLRRMLDDPRIEIAGIASNGRQAVDILDSGCPVDLVTMDIQMPVMQGDTALKHLMVRHGLPVLILSTLNPDEWETLFEYLKLGAVDFMPKPDSRTDIERYASLLRESVLGISKASASNFKRLRKPAANRTGTLSAQPAPAFLNDEIVVLIGGEGAYTDWLRLPLGRLCTTRATIGLQKLPGSYLPGFCRFLHREAQVEAKPLIGPTRIGPGALYVGTTEVPFEIGRTDGEELFLTRAPSVLSECLRDEGLKSWLEGLARGAGEHLSVCLLSSARAMPSDLTDTLIGAGARIVLAESRELMCTELVESVQPYLHIFPDKVFSVNAANLPEVL